MFGFLLAASKIIGETFSGLSHNTRRSEAEAIVNSRHCYNPERQKYIEDMVFRQEHFDVMCKYINLFISKGISVDMSNGYLNFMKNIAHEEGWEYKNFRDWDIEVEDEMRRR